MKLKKLEITNFRQFYGTVKLDFSTCPRKNVTVIHGANASGKTALLNAFRWCLYGKIDLPSPDKVVSNRLVVESDNTKPITVSIAIEFDHDDEIYRLERKRKYRKFDDLKIDPTGPSELTLSKIGGKDKQSEIVENPQDRIRQILPEDIQPYFFFDGEDISSLANAEDKIKDGIRNLMSITQIERGIKHLESCVQRFRKEYSNHSGTEAQNLDSQIAGIENDLQELNITESNTQKKINSLQKEKQLISERQKKLEPAKGYQIEREELELKEHNLDNELIENQTKQKRLIRSHGPLPFLRKAMTDIDDLIEDKRIKGDLPTGAKENFVKDLLNRGICLCERELPENSPERKAVQNFLLKKAGSAEVENRIQTLSGQIKDVNGEINDLNEGLKGLLERKHKILEEKYVISLRLSEITSELLGKDDVTEIAGLENRRNEIERDIRTADQELGSIRAKRENWLKEKADYERALMHFSDKAQRADLAKQRFQYCEEAKNILSDIYNILIEEVRKIVAERINGVLHRVTGNDFHVELTTDFRLLTLQKIGDVSGEIAKSTGQNQITSLAFIGALVDILRENYGREKSKKGETILRGGEYPIVMDSPFGSLDNVYGPRIASMASKLSPQVVVMVSGKQWLGGISEALSPNIGKQYVLIKNKPNPTKEDIFEGKVVLNNTEIQTVQESEKFEFTSIRELDNEQR
jgi:DNA sulfur modification protein DndD